MRKRDRNVAIGTLVAAGIGYAAGILTAPKSGRETRKDLQRAAVKAKKETEAKLKDLHSELSDLIDKSKSKAGNYKAARREEFDKAIEKAQKARHKARVILSAIHEGDAAEDADLQKAVNEVHKAIEHLKTYVEKQETKKT